MESFWLHRPSHARALAVVAGVVLLALLASRLADLWSPREARANLPLASLGLREIFLTSLVEDPARVLLTTRRENSTWTRDATDQRGDPYWIRRFGDPARPGLTQRILLTSRSRGARLLLPLGALDLERALSASSPAAGEESAHVRASLAQVFLDRDFAGVFLELRFPERSATEAGQPADFDLVVVRGNQVRTTDFLLQPNGRFYRAAIHDGRLPAGPFVRNASTGGELVFALWESAGSACTPLFVPVPLFDELALCWGSGLSTVVDDRWKVEALPAFTLDEPPRELRALVERAARVEIDARLESREEQLSLALATERLVDS